MSKPAATAKLRVFVPLKKVDEENRLVYGTITQEILDKSNEVMDYDTSKEHFEKWSSDISVATDGLSKGNVRVMHGTKVAGKLTEMEFNDDDKSIEVCAKVVDNDEWEMVKEGCYTGFSVGGKYAKRWTATVDGNKIKKYTAIPNEVSFVDNPCVPSATFSLVKADGAEEAVAFQVENDDDLWPGFAKADGSDDDKDDTDDKSDAEDKDDDDKDDDKKKDKKAEKAAPATPLVAPAITNEMIGEKAKELAKAAGPKEHWVDYVDKAREALEKSTPAATAVEEAAREANPEKETPEGDADKGTEEEAPATDEPAGDVSKVTPAGVEQKWNTSDGQAFAKKEDAVKHQNELNKAAEAEPDDAAARLRKAAERLKGKVEGEAEPTQPSIFSMERVEDLHKAFVELDQPREEDGAPKLEKGMYTVSRFSTLLRDVADISKTIKAEGKLEGDKKVDSEVAQTLIKQLGTFGESFIDYAKEQVAELVAGADVDLSPRACYDYYYRSAGQDNDLAKNVVEMIEEVEDLVEVETEKLAKFAADEAEVDEDSPETLAKIAGLVAENERLTKAVEDTTALIGSIEERLTKMEDTPEPRAPSSILSKGEDDGLLGRGGGGQLTEAQQVQQLEKMVKELGPDKMADLLIKSSLAGGGQPLGLARD